MSEPTSQQSESAFPDEDEDTITMLDVIERENKLEEEASAVLGNSDEKNCTYPLGYIARQALYSCATCFDGSGKQAAICLACSLECHENHDVYELYTKRNYRCDCGNSRFSSNFDCKLMDKQLKKLPINENNQYNHNFSGRYCKCDKRYPPDEVDDSEESQDDMCQCIYCEDWFHSKHLGVDEVPAMFEEMICGDCVEQLDFVHYYRDYDDIVDDDTVSPSADDNGSDDEQVCKLAQLIRKLEPDQAKKETLFWPDCTWRSRLCKCKKCIDLYETKKCSFLLDEKDSVQYYEDQGRTKAKDRETPLERGMSALNRMNRVAVAEALHGYNELKTDLSDYLRKFADNNKVVREEDIREFFQQLQTKKRPKTDP